MTQIYGNVLSMSNPEMSVFLFQVSLPDRTCEVHRLKLSEDEQAVYDVVFAQSRYIISIDIHLFVFSVLYY